MCSGLANNAMVHMTFWLRLRCLFQARLYYAGTRSHDTVRDQWFVSMDAANSTTRYHCLDFAVLKRQLFESAVSCWAAYVIRSLQGILMYSLSFLGIALHTCFSPLSRYTQRTSTIAKRLTEEWYSPDDVQEVSRLSVHSKLTTLLLIPAPRGA